MEVAAVGASGIVADLARIARAEEALVAEDVGSVPEVSAAGRKRVVSVASEELEEEEISEGRGNSNDKDDKNDDEGDTKVRVAGR